MDLDEWELLPVDGYLDFNEGDKIFSRRHSPAPGQKSVFNMDYFRCPSPTSSKMPTSRVVPVVPIQFDPPAAPDERLMREIIKAPVEIKLPSPITEKKMIEPPDGGDKAVGLEEADQDMVSQVFFKKMTEPEFADMKMDSPRSGTRGIFVPQIDAGAFQGEAVLDSSCSPRKRHEAATRDVVGVTKKQQDNDCDAEKATWDENRGGLNIWKWGFTGIGALCSFGVAAATICIIILGSQRAKQSQQNQKLRFQIYTDDKKLLELKPNAQKARFRQRKKNN
ncbi:uncharacterized protein LOC115730460 isoform X2 [Rhodamnia argentea]|uniref:Uncharacterized protein LOC115730460 isoform X2 n=1 Tax=Rhodamnia argentea TaxID=178133 RepID=A0A8B8N3F2_9MYRT|nr:uncharacterized protein LOC115730460 isoform X2 [Rhodamnia argentea]